MIRLTKLENSVLAYIVRTWQKHSDEIGLVESEYIDDGEPVMIVDMGENRFKVEIMITATQIERQ